QRLDAQTRSGEQEAPAPSSEGRASWGARPPFCDVRVPRLVARSVSDQMPVDVDIVKKRETTFERRVLALIENNADRPNYVRGTYRFGKARILVIGGNAGAVPAQPL